MPRDRILACLTYLYMLAMLAVIALILSTALVLQFVWGELPCPLCLLERLALFGAAFGVIQNLRGRFSSRYSGTTLIFALFLLIVSVRQTLLDIYPRPDHAYIGSAVLGLHMPVWSILIATMMIGAVGVKLALLGGDAHMQDVQPSDFRWLPRAAMVLGLYVLLLCLINLAAVFVQCGFGACHTMGYALLG